MTPQLLSTPNTVNEIVSSQYLWLGSGYMNPMLVTTNAPFYYNPLLLLHLFPTESPSLNMNDNNGLLHSLDWKWSMRGGCEGHGLEHPTTLFMSTS